MLYEEDWKRTRERFKAWWEQEIVDRVLIQVVAPKKSCEETKHRSYYYYGIFVSYDIIHKWADKGYDHEYLLEKVERQAASTYYGGDIIPFFRLNLGPGSLASYLGCQANFADDTVWFGPPILHNWNSFKIQFNPHNTLWKVTKELTLLASKRGKDKFLVSFADLGGVMDIIASLVGTEKLCLDLLRYPNKVKELRNHIVKVWIECYDELFNIVKKNQKGTLGWLPVLSPGKTYPLQCDFSAMISPEMYEEFVAPEIQTLARHLDNVSYHLDGPDAVKHLDIILDIPEIDAIQWVPGVPSQGTGSAIPWISMLRKIQKRKKSLYIYASEPGQVERLISELSPEGLLICTSCDSEEEARCLVKKVERWTTLRMRQ